MIWSGLVGVAVDVLNALIRGIGAALSTAVGVLPEMPEIPSAPTQVVDVEGWVAWVFPVQKMFDMLVFSNAMMVMWWAVSIALRWAKAERGSA